RRLLARRSMSATGKTSQPLRWDPEQRSTRSEVFSMTGENVQHTNQRSKKRTASRTAEYDPCVRGRYPVGVRTIQALDKIRDRLFPCEIWYPAAAQHAGHDIASGTQDFFTVPPGDTPRSQMAVRNAAARPGTYPPIVFSLLDHLLNGAAWDSEANFDPTRI